MPEQDLDLKMGTVSGPPLTPEQRRELIRRNITSNGGHKPLEILTYGGGAVGALYSWIISLGPQPVNITIACRSNYGAVSTSGYTITSELFGPGHFCPHRAIRSPAELLSPTNPPKLTTEFDLILVCTKATGKAEIPSYLVTENKTGIVLFQNGINIEEPYKLAFPDNTVISAVLYVACEQPSPGEIVHVGKIDYVKLGVYPDPPGDVGGGGDLDPKLHLITSLLQGGGCNAVSVLHVQSDRWLKTTWNGCWNVLCAVSGLDTHSFLASSPTSRDAVRVLSRELVSVARRALGVVDGEGNLISAGGRGNGVPEAVWELWRDEGRLVERNIHLAEVSVPITPSMLQDVRRGCVMEVEGFCGEVVRTGERLGVETKVLRTLYSILLAMNYRFTQAKL